MMLHGIFDLAYPGFRLLADFHIPARGVTAIFGASGSGKTSLLRCVAGLERAPTGYVTFGTDVWQDESRQVFLPPSRRALGYVFQEARLFPHVRVKGNLLYGWKRRAPQERKISFDQVVSLLGLHALLDRFPSTLSGGERQRVAIGRALMTSPQLLLMDEPLASLDVRRKKEILPFLEQLVQETHIPLLYVSHSLAEILQLTDTLLILESGRIVAQGPINDVLAQTHVASALGADIVGAVVDAKVVEHDATYGLTTLAFQGRHLVVPYHPTAPGKGLRVHISSKDVSVIVGPPPQHTSVLNILRATVTQIEEPNSESSSVNIQLDIGCPVVATITRKSLDSLKLHRGQSVWAQIKAIALTDEFTG